MITYKCTECGSRMESPASLAGSSETCPSCGHVRVVPQPDPLMRPEHSSLPVLATLMTVLGLGALCLGTGEMHEDPRQAADRAGHPPAVGDVERARPRLLDLRDLRAYRQSTRVSTGPEVQVRPEGVHRVLGV